MSKTYEYENEGIVICRGCSKEIFFKRTESGKYIPISKETGLPHFADCPNASDFRKRRQGPKQGREVRFKK